MPAPQSEVPTTWTPTSFFPGKKLSIEQETKAQKLQEEPNSSKRESEC